MNTVRDGRTTIPPITKSRRLPEDGNMQEGRFQDNANADIGGGCGGGDEGNLIGNY